MTQTPQERGYDFEDRWAAVFGVKPTKGSGSLWYAKLDVSTGEIIFSLKHTDHESFRVTTGMLEEALAAVLGPMGKGLNTIPAMGIEVGEAHHQFVVLPADDFIRIVTDAITFRQPSKSEVRRAQANLTGIDRKAQDDD